MKAKWMIRTVLLLGMVLLLTSCWNSRELKDLAIVLGMGVDKAPKTNEYRVSFQVVNPGSVASGAVGGGGGGSVTPVTVYTGTGNTLFEAIRKTSQKVPRQLFFAHIRLLVIGEGLAKEGIQELFDFFDRSHETRLTSLVLVARGGQAESIMKTIAPLEKIPAIATAGEIETTSKIWSENIKIEIDDVIKALVSEGKEPMMSGVKIVGNSQEGKKQSNIEQTDPLASMEIKGIGLFKEGKLKRWLDDDAARGVLWIQNKMESTIVNLDCKEKKEAIGIEITRSKTNVKAEVEDGKPSFHINIQEEGNVGEVKCPIDLSKPEEITKLEKEWKEETVKEVMKAVKIAQSEKSDIFGFGEEVKRADPKTWEKMKKEWSQTFAESKVDAKVDAFIRRTGMRNKPYLTERKK